MKLIISILCTVLWTLCRGDDTADYSGSGPQLVLEGKPLFVTCRVVAFDHIKWHLNGRPVVAGTGDDQYAISSAEADGYLTSNLTVASARPRHTGEYRCTSFVDNVYDVLVLSADSIETSAEDTGGLVVLTGTDDIVLECKATPERDVGAVTWFKSVEGSPREEVKADSRIVIKEGKLTISKPEETDTGNYTCSFDSEALGGQQMEETLQVVTNVTVRMTGKSINKQEGEDLTVKCRVYGKPTPAIRWTKNGEDVSSVWNSSRFSLGASDDGVPNANLHLKALVRPDDAGDYCCHAENVANAAHGCIIIRVKDKYAALWPFIGIVAEVILLTAIIYIYEKKKSKPDLEDSDTDHGNDRPEQKGDVRQRK